MAAVALSIVAATLFVAPVLDRWRVRQPSVSAEPAPRPYTVTVKRAVGGDPRLASGVLLLALLALTWGLGGAPLQRAEVYFLDGALGMFESGDWLVPRYRGEGPPPPVRPQWRLPWRTQ